MEGLHVYSRHFEARKFPGSWFSTPETINKYEEEIVRRWNAAFRFLEPRINIINAVTAPAVGNLGYYGIIAVDHERRPLLVGRVKDIVLTHTYRNGRRLEYDAFMELVVASTNESLTAGVQDIMETGLPDFVSVKNELQSLLFSSDPKSISLQPRQTRMRG
ncbi:MAG: hypothetical protein HY515_04850 [Candidatus Aenigmarchaeota archaeon]|nr:hypothetical protein [Candidatus Aenigmarchaeota archaeon]